MFENEECWILTGSRPSIFSPWKATKLIDTRTTGRPTRVEFDPYWVLDRQKKEKDIVGFMHTHPNMAAIPSIIDDATMYSWVCCFGKPLLCAIIGHDGLKFWLYKDDESPAILLSHKLRNDKVYLVKDDTSFYKKVKNWTLMKGRK